MAVCAILGNTSTAGVEAHSQHVRSPFQKPGQTARAGGPASTQADFVTLSQSFKAQLKAASGAIGQMLNTIGQALQAGNLTAARDALNSVAKVGPCAAPKGSHVPPMAGKLTQGLTALAEALESGDLSSAQSACAAVQQVWQQMSEANSTGGSRPSGPTGISVHI